MKEPIKVGSLLLPKDLEHLGVDLKNTNISKDIVITQLDRNIEIKNLENYDIILHKISDFIKGHVKGDKKCSALINFLITRKIGALCIDNPIIVLDLADRRIMSEIMDKCQFKYKNIEIFVPKWRPIFEISDNIDLNFPLICKAMCAGEGDGAHSMQLIFNKSQLKGLSVPCIAQEFINHEGTMVKIFVYGPKYFVLTRPSVRNFPTNGVPLISVDPVDFHSHEVSKMSAKTFLNNYQLGFEHKHSTKGDKIIDDDVAVLLIKKIQSYVNCTFLGIDLFLTNDGRCYNLFDINYLPSYDGVENRIDILVGVLKDFKDNGGSVNYWCK